jgi:hypothetical protein
MDVKTIRTLKDISVSVGALIEADDALASLDELISNLQHQPLSFTIQQATNHFCKLQTAITQLADLR